jgi:S-adenosyl-L-methionine hydrolase (adenosine-forming)
VTGRAHGCIFLLTDYGQIDEFVGVTKAVLARLAPGASLIDISHEVPAFDVRAGALTLERSAPHLGPGVIVGVVDPGVATARRPIALETRSDNGPRHLVGPDNGLLMRAVERLGGLKKAVVLARAAVPGADAQSTFDGRDLFAPAAAALWSGTDLDELGEPIDRDSLVELEAPALVVGRGRIESEVLWIDRFGNVQLSAGPDDIDRAGLTGALRLTVTRDSAPVEIRRVKAFAELNEQEVGLIVDANGHLALVGNGSSAALTLGLAPRRRVILGAMP